MIKLIEITDNQMLYEAFGIQAEQSEAIKKEIYSAFQHTNTWTECIGLVLLKDDTPMVEAFKMLTIGELMGIMKQL